MEESLIFKGKNIWHQNLARKSQFLQFPKGKKITIGYAKEVGISTFEKFRATTNSIFSTILFERNNRIIDENNFLHSLKRNFLKGKEGKKKMEHLVKVVLQIVSRFVTTRRNWCNATRFRDTIVSHCSSPRVKRKAWYAQWS